MAMGSMRGWRLLLLLISILHLVASRTQARPWILCTTEAFLICIKCTPYKKLFYIPVPSHLPNSFWAGICHIQYKLFPARESLVSDIPAGDGTIEKLFFTLYADQDPRVF
jgi:hypothetical protein